MILEIIENKDVGYDIMLNGIFFKYCKTYSELKLAVGSLVKSMFKEDAEGFV